MQGTFRCLGALSTEWEIVCQLVALEHFCCLVITWLTWNCLFSSSNTSSSLPNVDDLPHELLYNISATQLYIMPIYQPGTCESWTLSMLTFMLCHVLHWCFQRASSPTQGIYNGFSGRIEVILYHRDQSVDVESIPFLINFSSLDTAYSIGPASASPFGQSPSSSFLVGPLHMSAQPTFNNNDQK